LVENQSDPSRTSEMLVIVDGLAQAGNKIGLKRAEK
jgi:hypothetical protein